MNDKPDRDWLFITDPPGPLLPTITNRALHTKLLPSTSWPVHPNTNSNYDDFIKEEDIFEEVTDRLDLRCFFDLDRQRHGPHKPSHDDITTDEMPSKYRGRKSPESLAHAKTLRAERNRELDVPKRSRLSD